MAPIKKAALETETAGEKRWPVWARPRLLPTLAGAALPSAAIIWAHGENYAGNADVYLTQPPTVSRALANPAITTPFAMVMIISAALLLYATWQIVRGMTGLLRERKADRLSWLLLVFAAICEVPAILGMVVLSQFTGEAAALQHDIGSYMLFFGHSFAISASGWLIYRLLKQPNAAVDGKLAALSKLPRHAAWTALFSAMFGAAYFSNKHWPDVSPFWQHFALSLVEIVVLIAFLSYLGRFWRFIDKQAR